MVRDDDELNESEYILDLGGTALYLFIFIT